MTVGARRQLELPDLEGPDEAPEPPAPEPVDARACPGCGWYLHLADRTCPICHAPEDSRP